MLGERLESALEDAGARLDDLGGRGRRRTRPRARRLLPLGGRIVLETSLASLGYLRHVPRAHARATSSGRAGSPIEERTPARRRGAPPAAQHALPAVSAVGSHAGLFDAGADPAARSPPLLAAFVRRAAGAARARPRPCRAARLRSASASASWRRPARAATSRASCRSTTLARRLGRRDARRALHPRPGRGPRGLALTVARPGARPPGARRRRDHRAADHAGRRRSPAASSPAASARPRPAGSPPRSAPAGSPRRRPTCSSCSTRAAGSPTSRPPAASCSAASPTS